MTEEERAAFNAKTEEMVARRDRLVGLGYSFGYRWVHFEGRPVERIDPGTGSFWRMLDAAEAHHRRRVVRVVEADDD